MKFDEALELAQPMLERGFTTEEILARLRASGATPIDSLKVLRRLFGIDLARAKEIIDSSDTWADMREATEEIRRTAIKAILEEGTDQEPR